MCGGGELAAWGCENGDGAVAWVQVVIFYLLFYLLPQFPLEKKKAERWGGGGGGGRGKG